jgi:hypothetical protein
MVGKGSSKPKTVSVLSQDLLAELARRGTALRAASVSAAEEAVPLIEDSAVSWLFQTNNIDAEGYRLRALWTDRLRMPPVELATACGVDIISHGKRKATAELLSESQYALQNKNSLLHIPRSWNLCQTEHCC